MSENYLKLIETIKDIDFKMIRKNEKCWIKIEPIKRNSVHSTIFIFINGEEHHWDIYDQNGSEKHIVYFEGESVNPCFFIKSEKCQFTVAFAKNIKINTKLKVENIDDFLKNNCNCISQKVTCWAKDLFITSRPDKSPFNEM